MGMAGGLAANGQGGGGGSTGSLRRVMHPLASDNSGAAVTGITDILQRMIFTLPVTPIRWRLRIANWNNAGTVTLTDAYLGTPVFSSTGTWAGTIAASPTDILPSLSLPANGTELVTNWVTDGGTYIKADTPVVLSLGATPSSGAVPLTNGHNPGMCWSLTAGTGAAADVAVATPTHGTLFKMQTYLDIRLEYEVVTAMPIVMFWGDSILVGNPPPPLLSPANTNDFAISGMSAPFPTAAGLIGRFLAVNGGVAGSTTAQWVGGGWLGISRLAAWSEGDLGSANATPDVVVLQPGSNDAAVGTASATWAANYETLIGIAQGLGSGVKRIYGCTVIPRGTFKPGVLMASAASAATTLQTSIAYANADSLEIDHEVAFAGGQTNLAETVTVSGASAGSVAPYTTTVSALTKNHRQGAILGISNRESLRLDYNALIRQGFSGLDGIIDLEKHLLEPGTNNQAATRYFSITPPDTTSTHPNASGHAMLGSVVAAIGKQ